MLPLQPIAFEKYISPVFLDGIIAVAFFAELI
jgi:hypothetical protein